MVIRRCVPALLTAGVLAGVASAGDGLHDVDVILELQNDAVHTASVTGPDQTVLQRVFVVEMNLFFGFPFTEDPGFNSRLGEFPGSSVLRLNMLDSLRIWDGQDFDETAPFPLELARGDNSFFSDPSPGVVVNGPSMLVNSAGEVHVHPEHFLVPDAADGVYMMTYEIESNISSIEPSAPFYFVYDWNAAEQDVVAARDWVQNNLVSSPCPADLDVDGLVGASDLASLLGDWGGDGPSDLTGDGVVGADDLASMLGSWGPCE